MTIGSTGNPAMQAAQDMGNLLKEITAKQTNFTDKLVKVVVEDTVKTADAQAKAHAINTLA